MAEIADETKRSIVTVTGVTSELDLFNDVSESHSSTAGVIISKTGRDASDSHGEKYHFRRGQHQSDF